MNEIPKTGSDGHGDDLSAIFDHAAVRERPQPGAETAAYDVLHREWTTLTRARRRRRAVTVIGAAAASLAAVAIVFALLESDRGAPAPVVAFVERVDGAEVSWRDERSQAQPLGDRRSLLLGQRLATGDGTRVALVWHDGGSLRLDEQTRVEFVSTSSVRLVAGRLYFDSIAPIGESRGAPPALSVQTPAGDVLHVGTQFMVTVDDDEVMLSVREGQVKVTGDGFELVVDAHEQLDIGSRERTPIPGSSEAWSWAAEIAPLAELEGRSALEIVTWAARETGRRVVFLSADAETRARANIVRGVGNRSPAAILVVLPHLTELSFELVDDDVVVSTR